MKKIFIITGEYSGDMHAGRVAEILKQKNPDIEIEGIGGENLKKAGAKIYCDHSKMSGFGFSIKMALDHIALEKKVADYLLNSYKPDLVLLIDYGTFNLRVAKRPWKLPAEMTMSSSGNTVGLSVTLLISVVMTLST